MDKKLNGFNNSRDTTDGVGGGESLEENMKWCAENMEIKKEKTMFEEMEAQGSNIPNKVEYLQSHGWQSYKHHDNWVRKDLKDWEKDLCNFDLNSAYEEALREANELSNAIRVLCNALREDTTEGSYYYSWMCNIKMTMYDAMRDNGNIKDFNQEIILNMCEDGAKNFLNLLVKQ